MQSIDISNLNLKEIQYINGEQFENLLKSRFFYGHTTSFLMTAGK